MTHKELLISLVLERLPELNDTDAQLVMQLCDAMYTMGKSDGVSVLADRLNNTHCEEEAYLEH